MKLIYVSHPYTGNEEENKRKAMAITAMLQARDPENWYVCPLDGTIPDSWGYDKCLEHCLERLAKCDEAIFCGGWTISNGCRKEYVFAAAHGIPRRGLRRNGQLLSQEETDRCF